MDTTVLATRMAQPEPPAVEQAALPPNFYFEAFDRRKIRWSRWVERLETAFAIYNVTVNNLRRNFLLHLMGAETYEIACDKVAPQNIREMEYQQIVDTLEAHFNPQPLEISENFRFKCRRQGDKNASSPEETVDEYLVALRRIAVTCNFGTYLETALRNQLVFGLKRNDIRGRLLERRQLTLQDARDIAVSMELSLKGGAEIEGAIAKQEVNALQKPQGKAKNKKVGSSSQSSSSNAGDLHCYRCGDKSHLANQCKHQSTVCSYCKVKGHLERVCQKAAGKKPVSGSSGRKPGSARTHHIEQESEDGSVDNFSVGEICTLVGRPGDAKL